MKTEIIKADSNSMPSLVHAAALLKAGDLVAFPTETVYGLGAVFNNDDAILRIFAVKGRPADNPLIVHIWHNDQLAELAERVPSEAKAMMEAFWPGPLTLVLPKLSTVSEIVSAGLKTVAVRMPSHPVALALLKETGIPIAAPSANLSGRPSPTRGEHVIEDLSGKISIIIDAGPTAQGVESTVVSFPEAGPVVLRPGSVTREMIEKLLNRKIGLAAAHDSERPQSPGMKYRHYAPQAPVLLFEGEPEKVIAAINRELAELPPAARPVVIAAAGHLKDYQTELVLDLGPAEQPEIAASRLFELLRFCDRLKVNQIFIEGVTPAGIGVAVADRLHKAAGGRIIHVS